MQYILCIINDLIHEKVCLLKSVYLKQVTESHCLELKQSFYFNTAFSISLQATLAGDDYGIWK